MSRYDVISSKVIAGILVMAARMVLRLCGFFIPLSYTFLAGSYFLRSVWDWLLVVAEINCLCLRITLHGHFLYLTPNNDVILLLSLNSVQGNLSCYYDTLLFLENRIIYDKKN